MFLEGGSLPIGTKINWCRIRGTVIACSHGAIKVEWAKNIRPSVFRIEGGYIHGMEIDLTADR